MIIDNKIDKTLSGPNIFMGIAFLITGISLIAAFKFTAAILSLIVFSFLIFSYSGIDIDTEKKAIRPYNKFFGIIKTGKWKALDNYVGLTLVPMKKVYSIFSRSNRNSISFEKEFRVFLINKARKPAIPLKVCKTRELAQDSMDEFAIWLKLPVYSVHKH